MTAVSRYITAQVTGNAGIVSKFPARLAYDSADGIAVILDFADSTRGLHDPDVRVRWVFARDLLVAGVASREWFGLGDVQVRSVGSRFFLRLMDKADVSLTSEDVSEFLSLTYRILPDGEEFDTASLDAELAEIMGGK